MLSSSSRVYCTIVVFVYEVGPYFFTVSCFCMLFDWFISILFLNFKNCSKIAIYQGRQSYIYTQGSLACCSPWNCKELDMTKQPDNSNSAHTHTHTHTHTSVQFSLVAQSCLTLWDPKNHRMPGLPAHHQLPESTQTHVRWVGDAIQPSHPLSSPSPPALNLSQHQGLFKWVSSSYQVAKYCSFSFNISPSNEHPGMISF